MGCAPAPGEEPAGSSEGSTGSFGSDGVASDSGAAEDEGADSESGGAPTDTPEPEPLPPEPAADPFEPDAPLDRWQLRRDDAPNSIWETGIVYDPRSGRVLRHGGHVGGPQDSYVWTYGLRDNDFILPATERRPQRRCITQVAFIDSLGAMFTAQGVVNHGSINQGVLLADGTDIVPGQYPGGPWERLEPVGPWLYDVEDSTWFESKEPNSPWGGMAAQGAMWYGPMVYMPASDAVFGLARDHLAVYLTSRNTIVERALPAELTDRIGYGMAALVEDRKILVFGGIASTSSWNWNGTPEQKEASYLERARDDTWIYDVVEDTWTQLSLDVHPPSGAAMDDNLPLTMITHAPSGRALLWQSPVDAISPRDQWALPDLWVFDPGSESWSIHPTEDRPQFRGLLAYAEGEDMLVGWGGEGSSSTDHWGPRVATNNNIYSLRLSSDGAEHEPPPPDGVRVQAVDEGTYELSWDAYDGIEYVVFRAPVFDGIPGEYAPLRAVSGVSRITDTPGDGAYAYRVGRSGRERRSYAVFTRPTRVQRAYVGIIGDDQVRVSWESVPGASRYEVWERRADTEQFELVGQTAELEYERTVALDDGIVREYQVFAVDPSGLRSGPSSTVGTLPEVPLHLDAVLTPDDRIEVSWSWPVEVPIAGVDVYYRDHWQNIGGTARHDWQVGFTKVNDAPVTESSFTFDIPPGDSSPHHLIYVRAVNPRGQSGYFSDAFSPIDSRFVPPAQTVTIED